MSRGLIFFAMAAGAAAQNGPAFRVDLPPSVASEKVFLQYCVDGPEKHCSWVHSRPGLEAYSIEEHFRGRRIDSLKGIMYVPGCAMETFSMTAINPAYAFRCRPLGNVDLRGEFAEADAFVGKKVELQITYAATWTKEYFGTEDIITDVPLGGPSVFTGSAFRFDVPDFGSDSVTASGFLYIWVKESATGKLVALLIPTGSKHMVNSLPVQSRYPEKLAFVSCAANGPVRRDRFGFAIRGKNHACTE